MSLYALSGNNHSYLKSFKTKKIRQKLEEEIGPVKRYGKEDDRFKTLNFLT